MKQNMGLFLFHAKSNIRLPKLLSLLQQDHQKCILRNSHSGRFLLDEFMYPSR